MELLRKLNERADTVIIEFLKGQGYEITEPYDESLERIQEDLRKQGKYFRCELFFKTDIEEGKVKMVILPFFDSLITPVSRKEVYTVCKLEEQGYIM